MKKTLLLVAVLALGATACKKNRTCECTNSSIAPSGAMTTDPTPRENTLKNISKHDAKTLCQKKTEVQIASNGDAFTTINDCKLK